MVEQSGFRNVIDFLVSVGVYDVILPFLLVFTIIFAILEKTKILGVDKDKDGREYTKKNLNAVFAFVSAFLVVASVRLVGAINEIIANVVLLVLLGICFLMLVGVFYGDKEFTLENHKKWLAFFIIIMFTSIVAIFLNALGWLQFIFALFTNFDIEIVGSILFFLIIIGFILLITWDTGPKKSSGDKDKH